MKIDNIIKLIKNLFNKNNIELKNDENNINNNFDTNNNVYEKNEDLVNDKSNKKIINNNFSKKDESVVFEIDFNLINNTKNYQDIVNILNNLKTNKNKTSLLNKVYIIQNKKTTLINEIIKNKLINVEILQKILELDDNVFFKKDLYLLNLVKNKSFSKEHFLFILEKNIYPLENEKEINFEITSRILKKDFLTPDLCYKHLYKKINFFNYHENGEPLLFDLLENSNLNENYLSFIYKYIGFEDKRLDDDDRFFPKNINSVFEKVFIENKDLFYNCIYMFTPKKFEVNLALQKGIIDNTDKTLISSIMYAKTGDFNYIDDIPELFIKNSIKNYIEKIKEEKTYNDEYINLLQSNYDKFDRRNLQNKMNTF